MDSTDVITFQQEIVKIIRNKEAVNELEDPNKSYLLSLLQKQPLTLDDIYEKFKANNNSKSIKTIYRYLNQLKKVDLISEAGKRVISDKSDIKTETLYLANSKFALIGYFLTDLENYKKSIKNNQTYDVLGLLLAKHFGFTRYREEKYEQFLFEIGNYMLDRLKEILETLNPEVMNKLTELDWEETRLVLHRFGLFLVAKKFVEYNAKLDEYFI